MNNYKPLLLSALSGILLSLPWLLPGSGWLMLIAFVPLLIADEQKMQTKAHQSLSFIFTLSFTAFLIWNLLTCWWISYVSLTGMLLITIINSLIMASVWWGKSFIGKRLGAVSGYFSLLVFWIAFEFLHHNWSLRWPWLTLGNGFSGSVKIIQWYEFTGVLGGSLWILISNIFIFRTIRNFSKKSFRKSLTNGAFALLLILLPTSWSLFRYYSYKEKADSCEVVVLQPNINPYTEKFSGMSSDQQVNLLIQLADSTITKSTDFVLAPETALPECWENSTIKQNPELNPVIKLLKEYPELSFVAGVITRRKFGKDEAISKTARLSEDKSFYYDLYNSALLIDTTSQVQIYHKSILVSGVERMPFQEYFSFLRKYIINLGGASGSFAAASEPEIFKGIGKIKIGPIICFESVFGARAATQTRKGANLLFVMTNDGWWKESSGVRQHFDFARLRAIETRRSIARSANTGISGFINQRGDAIRQTKINASTAIVGNLNLNDELTFYVRQGDYIGWIGLIFSVLILVYLILYNLKHQIK